MMILSVVEAASASSKPPADDDNMRTSTGGKCRFSALVPSLIRASPMPFSEARGSAIYLKLVKLVGSSSTRADELSLYFFSSAAMPSVRSQVLVSGFSSASVTRRGC